MMIIIIHIIQRERTSLSNSSLFYLKYKKRQLPFYVLFSVLLALFINSQKKGKMMVSKQKIINQFVIKTMS